MAQQTLHRQIHRQLPSEIQCEILTDFFKYSPLFIEPFSSSSNFKRQNTIDAATIKENTTRLATQNQRPVSAQPKTTTESGEIQKLTVRIFFKYLEFPAASATSPVKPRTALTTKYDGTASGNRTVGPAGGLIPRRSTTLYEKTSSTEKTNVSTDNT